MTRLPTALWLALLAVVAVACDGDDDTGEPSFPANYADTYTEVRNCRANGGSHDFNRIRVLVDPSGLTAYRDRTESFPVGAVVLKEEYESNDTDCSGAIKQWSVMERLAAGNEDTLNWRWQRVDFSHTVQTENEPRCFGCHNACTPPDGFENTCTVP
jgi:hypothetical protein